MSLLRQATVSDPPLPAATCIPPPPFIVDAKDMPPCRLESANNFHKLAAWLLTLTAMLQVKEKGPGAFPRRRGTGAPPPVPCLPWLDRLCVLQRNTVSGDEWSSTLLCARGLFCAVAAGVHHRMARWHVSHGSWIAGVVHKREVEAARQRCLPPIAKLDVVHACFELIRRPTVRYALTRSRSLA